MKKISTTKIKSQAANKKVTVGIDLGDRTSRYCLLDEEGLVIAEGGTPTTKAGIAKVFWCHGTMPGGVGDRMSFAVGEPAAAGARSSPTRGTCV